MLEEHEKRFLKLKIDYPVLEKWSIYANSYNDYERIIKRTVNLSKNNLLNYEVHARLEEWSKHSINLIQKNFHC